MRTAEQARDTRETQIKINMNLDGTGAASINTGIPFFDHMLTLFAVHGFFDLTVTAVGDLDVDAHHTVEDVGLVLGTVFKDALGDRKGIVRYGHAVTPMDETLSAVTVDLSNRPYLVYHHPDIYPSPVAFDLRVAKEFFRAFSVNAAMNLHINVQYGENEHHILESIFKAMGRALRQAVSRDSKITGVLSTKGVL